MPAKKQPARQASPSKSKPAERSTPSRTRAMDPDLEAKRSGPPSPGPTMPKPLADPDAGFEEPKPQQHADTSGPAVTPENWPEVEQKLQDPRFDPEGHERLRLAEESRHMESDDPYPPTTNVDERGDPMRPGERNPERQA